jgi:8-oxo-dGTP pyrophosphatase MutT (NUDIX family)
VPLSIRLRRAGYRLAYRLLTIWWFVRRPTAQGVKCVLTNGPEVLLVRHTYGPAVWDLPGGSLKRGEQSLSAAEREMAEELGIQGADWRGAGTIRGRQSFRRDTIHCFAAELQSRAIAPNEAELAQTRWFAWSALPDRLGTYAAAVLKGGPP